MDKYAVNAPILRQSISVAQASSQLPPVPPPPPQASITVRSIFARLVVTRACNLRSTFGHTLAPAKKLPSV